MDQQDRNQSSSRKYLTSEEKFKIIKEHLTTKTGATEICKKYGIGSSQFYNWLEQFYEGALAGFDKSKRAQSIGANSAAQVKIEEQRREIERMREVVLEIAAENVQLKKTPGALLLRK
jgi:transposase-like protein